MSTHATLGRCPRCESQIPDRRLLIEYETDDGPAMFAECPACRDVVHPS
jgi:NAD-dependent SIR2 family protein deacetylase